jgi:hypothetical protein
MGANSPVHIEIAQNELRLAKEARFELIRTGPNPLSERTSYLYETKGNPGEVMRRILNDIQLVLNRFNTGVE